jgi:acetyl-CoA acetyltransferase
VAEAFVVDAVRTPVTRRGGALSGVHPADLGAHVIRALLNRAGADPLAVDDVVFGCVDTIGPQAGNIARTAWLAAGLPEQVPGVTVDRQCGSSLQAVHFAAQAVLSGTADLVVAGGVQNMSRIPISAAMLAGQAYGFDDPFSGSGGWRARYGGEEISQFRAADMIAAKWGISRGEMEEYALASHQRAAAAMDAGAFGAEIAAYGNVTADECPRRDTSAAAMAALPPLRADGGDHRGAVQPDRRRRGRGAGRLGRGGPHARAAPPGADPPAHRARRRPGAHAHRAHRGDRARAAAGRAEPRPDRPGGDQRGLRVGGARLAARDRRGPRAGECQRRGDRAGAPAGGDRRAGCSPRC